MSLLALENVRKSYRRKVVLDDISLSVEAHEVVCLIGSSGSGKSTLLRVIDRLEEIDDGIITFDGREISDPLVDPRIVRRDIGMVFQAYNLFPHLSVLANCTLAPTKVHGQAKREARDYAMELLTRFGLSDKAKAHPDALSGGQQQRVALVRALSEPRLKRA
jgi:polar amino acid transport system ATP-binding protein